MNTRTIRSLSYAFFIIAVLVGTPTFAQGVPPETPASISIQPGLTSVTVIWEAARDDDGIAGYYLYRNGVLIANTADIMYTDAPPPGYYSYTVAAIDVTGAISPKAGPTQSVSIVKDTIAPSTPSGLTAAAASTSIELSWAAATDNAGVVGYYLSRNRNNIGGSPITETKYSDQNIPSGYYTYAVSAYDAAGNVSQQAPPITIYFVRDASPPTAPAILKASAISPSSIEIIWQKAADNIGIAQYEIYRNDSIIGTVASTTLSHTDTGLTADTDYLYRIVALDGAGNRSPENRAQSAGARTFPPDRTPPSLVSLLSGTAVSGSEIELAWSAASDDTKISGYTIFQDELSVGDTASTTYRASGLATSTVYTFGIEAYDEAGNRSGRVSRSVTTLAHDPARATTSTGDVLGIVTTSLTVIGETPPPEPFLEFIPFGARNDRVRDLQLVLIREGNLGAEYATGYFGPLTREAIQKFQCSHTIVCSGDPNSTGYGVFGPRTRAALNELR